MNQRKAKGGRTKRQSKRKIDSAPGWTKLVHGVFMQGDICGVSQKVEPFQTVTLEPLCCQIVAN